MQVKFNMSQQPKTPGYLSTFKARPGYKLVQVDLAAVEPKVIAAFSRDETMLSLYGPDAKPNDVYLYNAAHIELFRDEIRKYYDPNNPTNESIAAAKKHCKKIRQFNKIITLASGYGASAKKVRSILITSGYPVTVKEAEIIHRDYWRLYSGIKRFDTQLRNIWGSTGGWIPSLVGKPICVPSDYLNDIVNRFAQTSGHEVLMMLVYEINKLVRETGIEAYPWIPDFHDETIWEVRESDTQAMVDIMNLAMDRVNERLDMDVKMSGEPQIADNLAEIKCEDYYEWKALQSRVV
jgi:DNA polymerase I-like protein with 3'-5' exonuclease and polymerase domains